MNELVQSLERQLPPPLTQPPLAKVILVGNSGRGKSFLCNVLLGKNAFDHRTFSRSVTADVTFEMMSCLMNDGYGAPVNDHSSYNAVDLCVMNVPGLVEADEGNWERNQMAVESAIRAAPWMPLIVLFITQPSNGRVIDEDTMIFRIVMDFLSSMPAASTGVIVNCVDPDEFDTATELERFKLETEQRLVAAAPRLVEGAHDRLCSRLLFFNKIRKEERQQQQGDAVRDVQRALRRMVLTLRSAAVPVATTPNKSLRFDRQALRQEIQELHKYAKQTEEASAAELKEICRRREEDVKHLRAVQEVEVRNQQRQPPPHQQHSSQHHDSLTQQQPHYGHERIQNVLHSSTCQQQQQQEQPYLSQKTADGQQFFAYEEPPNPNTAILTAAATTTPDNAMMTDDTKLNLQRCEERVRRLHPAIALNKVLILGRSGVGKSFVANILTEGEPLFPHANKSTPVTQAVQCALLPVDPGDTEQHILYDMTGLIALHEGTARENANNVSSALGHLLRETHRLTTTFIFVVCPNNGRMSMDDLQGVRQVMLYVRTAANGSSNAIALKALIVVNAVDASELDGTYSEFRATTTQLIANAMSNVVDCVVVFIPKIAKASVRFSMKFGPEELFGAHYQLQEWLTVGAITSFMPPSSSRTLLLSRNHLLDDAKEIQSTYETYNHFSKEASAKRQQMMLMQQQHDRELSYLRDEIRRLESQPPRIIIIKAAKKKNVISALWHSLRSL